MFVTRLNNMMQYSSKINTQSHFLFMIQETRKVLLGDLRELNMSVMVPFRRKGTGQYGVVFRKKIRYSLFLNV